MFCVILNVCTKNYGLIILYTVHIPTKTPGVGVNCTSGRASTSTSQKMYEKD